MQHRQADLLMKEVEKHYKGDFLLNGDLQLSRRMAAALQKKEKNRFYGSNGLFSPAKMFGTEGCEKTADCITVPQGGTVYGPYFTFPAGAYTAQFRVEQAEAITVSVACQGLGVIVSQAVSSPRDAVISLDFSLPELTEQLEFKVENRAAAPVLFRSVEIIPENLQMSEPEVLAPEANTAEVAASDASASLIDDLNDALALKRQSDRQQKELAQKADCDLPAHTRLRRIKLLLRRLMRPFTLMQTVFNHSVVASLHNLQEQINLLLATLTKIDQQQLSHVSFREDERNSFTVRYEKMQQQNAALSERLDTLSATLAQRDSDAALAQQQNAALSERLDALSAALAQIQDAPKTDPAARQEIANLWDKIREYDANFRGIWKSEGDINANLGSVWSTYSTFRQEIFYELDARTRSAGAAQPLHVEAKIKDSAREKMRSADGQIRLNLGSGNLAVEGYLNTDARDLPNVDIVADVAELPFEAGTVDEIFSAHLIEHFTRSRMEKELLPYWYSLLKPGGTFRVIFPDLEAMIDAYNASQMSFEQMGNVIMGGQDYQLDYHYAVYSPETVTKLLEKAGLRNIRILAQGRENGGCKETEILAEK